MQCYRAARWLIHQVLGRLRNRASHSIVFDFTNARIRATPSLLAQNWSTLRMSTYSLGVDSVSGSSKK